VKAIRFLAADAVDEAGSGHLETPIALAALACRLCTKWLFAMIRRGSIGSIETGWCSRSRMRSRSHEFHSTRWETTSRSMISFVPSAWVRDPGHPEGGETPSSVPESEIEAPS
jgi:hypothetical protein